VRSLVSIMSTTGRLTRGQPSPRLYPLFLRRPAVDREAFVARMERVFTAIGSPGFPRDLDEIGTLARESFERDPDPRGPGRQLAAVIASGDRTRELHGIRAPTLVIHGSADRLVGPSGGRATARAIPGSTLMMVNGMGHDLPRAIWPRLIDAIAQHARRADVSAESVPPLQAPPPSVPGL
jgi:pimeloyl-ACP methyl ester carboxylesterase